MIINKHKKALKTEKEENLHYINLSCNSEKQNNNEFH